MSFQPITDIFCVTFGRDYEFCTFLLQSYRKFATGFHRLIILVPLDDFPRFERLGRKYGDDIVVKWFEQVPDKGMMHHEAMVCRADEYCNADYILHMDADCIFKEPVTPSDYFINGKPVMLREPFDKLGPEVRPWQDAVERALGFKPYYETMRRHPAVHPRHPVYMGTRLAVEAHTKMPFTDYVLSCRNEYPQGFAEFPTLGAWALHNAPTLHHWIDADKERPADKILQFWSHGGLDFVPTDGPSAGKPFRQTIQEFLG